MAWSRALPGADAPGQDFQGRRAVGPAAGEPPARGGSSGTISGSGRAISPATAAGSDRSSKKNSAAPHSHAPQDHQRGGGGRIPLEAGVAEQLQRTSGRSRDRSSGRSGRFPAAGAAASAGGAAAASRGPRRPQVAQHHARSPPRSTAVARKIKQRTAVQSVHGSTRGSGVGGKRHGGHGGRLGRIDPRPEPIVVDLPRRWFSCVPGRPGR